MCRRMRHLKPREIQGCQLALDASIATSLYDATSGGSLVAADGAVARWEDQSGNARHATQATGASQPARKTAIQGGLDVLRFDGSSDHMNHGATSGVDPHTLFVVAVRRATQTSYRVLMTYGTSANNGSSFNLRNSTDFVGTYTTTDANSTYTPGVDEAFTVSQRENSGISWIAKGLPAGTAAGNAATSTVARIAAGANAGLPAFHAQCDFCEAAAYNLSIGDMVALRLHGAKMRKWRING